MPSETKQSAQPKRRSAGSAGKRSCCGIPPADGGHHGWCLQPHRRAGPPPRVRQEPVDPRVAVTRIDHSPLEDRLEEANARALEAWLRGGRTL